MNLQFLSKPAYFSKDIKPFIVDEKLVRGASILSPFKIKKAKEKGVTQIIDLRNSAKISGCVEKLLCNMFGIKYQNYKFPHRQKHLPSKDFFEEINKTIVNNEGKTYVHCQYGHHRTGLAVAIYEKLHSVKSESEIVENMICNGYRELISSKKTQKEKKYLQLYNQMIDVYFCK